jgi:hypothetical protein
MELVDGLSSNLLMTDKVVERYDETVGCLKEESSTPPDLQAFGPGWRVEFRPLEVETPK